MAHPTWSGSISFGLVTVPVELFTAVRSHAIRFKQLRRGTHVPVKQKRVDSQTGEEVAYSDIVKGYETDDGHYVVAEPDELATLDPRSSRLISIHAYVEQSDIDPVYYDRPYYLAPDGEAAAKPYRLLSEAMERSDKVAIATFVMRNREYLAAMRARHGLLLLSTMHYADEVADPTELRVDLAQEAQISQRELDMAEQLIGSLLTEFDPTSFRDDHRQRLIDYLEAKGEGRRVPVADSDRGGDNVVDLMAALEQSLSRAQGQDADAASPGPGPYQDMTRDELYALARERDIPGRSSLSKAELITALGEADRRAGAA